MLPQLADSQTLSNDRLFHSAAQFLNTDEAGLNKILWETYHPNRFGLVLIGIGILTVLILFFYDRYFVSQSRSKE
jgi:hypothetical protein